ncbi:uncharacterized protein Z518_11121 [Rhinocladiella mackenziei CBS 650.93]|uniref:Nuclear pore complex protein An-Nup120 n=1 Tax=Rhinocladiella mackenziei CBS 650.93 TaxID=1442369 RepID=A0A0D2I1U1_9EURO|nr:uncharacterized protein Z518_11121 [Rhinocladiella mackenziei CBS 650.93]KIW99708.1 hypothetical protein Z518_11121 [Rhinocladiella mackenziei CBS 650.93]
MLNLYTETTFQVTPATRASVVDYRIPRRNGSYDRSKFSSRQNDRSFTKNEQAFASHVLASESSIFFRRSKSYPRTFHWSIVNEGRVLQIRCSDLARSEGDVKEAYFTLRFEFQDSIIPRGATFADSDNGEEIHVFICTTKNELFHLRLPTTAFRDPDVLQTENLTQWCQYLESSALGIDTVHRVYASSPQEVFLSFISGMVQRLQQRSRDGSWTQDNYDDRTWGASLRGIVSRRGLQTIEYGAIQLDSRTAQAMATSPDGKFLFTVCLNHTLRVWNLLTGKVVVTNDLLDAVRDPNDRTHLNPAEDALLQIFKLPLQRYPVLLTYTPQDGGQFKFWDIKGGTTEPLFIEDKYPGVKLSSPDPDPSGNTMWSLVGFGLNPGTDFKPAQLWVLWRNHNYHQLYNCQFEFSSIVNSWKSNWIKCASTSSSKNVAPDLVKSDPEDPASKWLDFLFHPGRYSEDGLETALSIFEEATAVKLPSSQRTAPLRQRMGAVVAAGVSLRKYGDSDLDFQRFCADTDSHWRNFYRIVETVNDGRNAPLSLAYDVYTEMVWITMADKCCAIRECSKIELLQQNEVEDIDDLEEVAARAWTHRKVSTDDGESFRDLAVLISAARTFRESFGADFAKDLIVAIEEDMSIGAEFVTPTRIYEIFDSIGFSDAISNDVFERLETDLTPIGGLSSLTNELFLGVLELLVVKSKRTKSTLRNTMFGNLLWSAGMVDLISSRRQLLMDLLTLAIFVEGELNQEDVKLTAFDASELFHHITPLLRLYDRNLWLVSHFRLVPVEIMGPDGHPNAARQAAKPNPENYRLVSIFEDTLGKAVRPQPAADKPLMYSLTDQLSEIDDWASGKDTIATEDGAVYLQCDLLMQGEFDLATDFLKFQPSTSWSSYVKGRLAIAKGEYDMAANYFRKSSYGLARGKAVGNLVALSAGLLSMIEAEYFNNGLPLYLHHITALFEAAKAFNQASQFAHLTLEALQSRQKEPVANFRADVLSRLFNAELQLSRLDRAYDALVQLPDPALQRSSATAVINSILNSRSSVTGAPGAVKILQSLPWTTYPHLARHMDQHLVSLAKNQTSVGTKYSQWLAGDGSLDYLAILYAMRVAQKDYHGAVTVLYDRLRLIRRSGRARHDPQATALRQVLLSLINVMACVGPEEAYLLAEVDDKARLSQENEENAPVNVENVKRRRRIIITLEDLRKEYQEILDKCSRIERGDFDFEIDGETDEEDDDDFLGDQSRLNLSSRLSDTMEF